MRRQLLAASKAVWSGSSEALARRDDGDHAPRRDPLPQLPHPVVSQFLGPLFSLVIFYYISQLLTPTSVDSPGGYFGFVVIGLVIVQILTISLGVMPVTVRQELVSGTIERFLVSAHGPVNGIFGAMLFPLVNALFSGALMLVLGDRPLRPAAGGDGAAGDPGRAARDASRSCPSRCSWWRW